MIHGSRAGFRKKDRTRVFFSGFHSFSGNKLVLESSTIHERIFSISKKVGSGIPAGALTHFTVELF